MKLQIATAAGEVSPKAREDTGKVYEGSRGGISKEKYMTVVQAEEALHQAGEV